MIVSNFLHFINALGDSTFTPDGIEIVLILVKANALSLISQSFESSSI